MEIRLVAGKVLSRRVSEFLGVVLFGAALVSLIALATYDVDDAVWFFNTGGETPPANLAGRVGALLAEVAHQLIGYASLLIPVTLAVVGGAPSGAGRSTRCTRSCSASAWCSAAARPSSA